MTQRVKREISSFWLFSLVGFWIWNKLSSVHTNRNRCGRRAGSAFVFLSKQKQLLRPRGGRARQRSGCWEVPEGVHQKFYTLPTLREGTSALCSQHVPSECLQTFGRASQEHLDTECLCVWGESFACSLLHHWDREKFPYLSVCVRKHHSWERSCGGWVETQVFRLVLKLNVADRSGSEYQCSLTST